MQAREHKPITERRQIGKGKRSFVYEGEYKGQLCARKETSHDNNKKEIEILKKLQHDNIIKYIDTERNKQGTKTCTYLELCYCNLEQYFADKCIDLSPIEVLRQVVEGVTYLHNGHTVHGDLNLSHILLQHVERENKWVVKICGFGSSENLDPDKAPELLPARDGSPGQGKRGKEADIFSLARVFYYLLSDGKHLHIKDTKELCELGNAVIDHSANMNGLKNEYKDNAEKLILSMLEKNRVTICEIRLHFLFWKPSKTVLFFKAVSNLTYKNKQHQRLSNELDAKCLEITDGNWWKKITGEEYPGIRKFSTSKYAIKSLELSAGLMRQIRNWASHYSEDTISQQLRNDLGSFPDGFTKFCKSNFPLLLPHVYEVMKDVRNYTEMKEFYAADDARLKTDTSSSAFRSKSIGDSEELMLHDYQRELAKQASEGKNSLIIAPTGSGSTAVIAEIIQKHIKKNPDDKAKIILMVPKTALAHQQYAFLKRYLTTCSVGYVIDEVAKVNLHKIIKSNKVTVLNAQILINELKRKLDTFGDISMLLFDECHRAFGKHPYKQVMDLYYGYRKAAEIERNIQIVGVTTYPGISKIKERVTVKENLIQLLVNMGITLAPCTVENNIDDLEKYREKANEYCVVEKADQTSPKLEEVIKTMQAIEKELKYITEENHVTYLSKIPEDRSKESYEEWTEELKSYGRLEMKDQNIGTKLIAFAENLKMYHVLLQLKDLVPNAMGCVDKMVTTQTEKYEEGFLAKKKGDLQKKEEGDDVPMYKKMIENLKKQFENKSEARCIVFVKREHTAESLVKFMLEDDTLSAMKPKHLTWTDSAGIGEDENKIHIATAVPKNGFDIEEYNLIVLYNYVPYFDSSSLPTIKKIARRDSGGNSRILLMRLKDDEAISFDELENSIQDLKRIAPKDLVQKIKKKQEEARDWKILCGKCKKFLTTGEKLHRITSSDDFKDTHLYVNDRDFPSRLEKKEDSDRKCRIKIEDDMDYPAIPIDKILLRRSNGELREPKDATNMPFSVKEITEDSGDEDDMDTANVVPMYQDESFYDDENLEALQMLLDNFI